MGAGQFIRDLLNAQINKTGTETYGTPNWRENAAAAKVGLARQEQELANMPTAEDAAALREATIANTEAMADWRGAQTSGMRERLDLARADAAVRKANSDFARDPNNPASKLKLAQAEKYKAEATLAARRAANPDAFRSTPRGGQPSYQALVDPVTGEVRGYYNIRNPTDTQPVQPEFEGMRKTPLSSPEVEKRALLESTLSDAEYLDALIQQPNVKGVIGPVVGRFTDLKRKWGAGVEPDINDLFHISDNLSDMLLRARSGAQINEQEYRRLRILVPDPRTPFPTFSDNLRRFRIEAGNVLAARRGQPVSQMPPQGGTPVRPAAAPAPSPAAPAAGAVEEWVRGPDGKLTRRR